MRLGWERGLGAVLIAFLLGVAMMGWSDRQGAASRPGVSTDANGLAHLERDLGRCPHCLRLVFLESRSMPLSAAARSEIVAAASSLGLPVSVLVFEDLWGVGSLPAETPERAFARWVLAELSDGGSTLHFPSVSLFRGLGLEGHAILGHKSARGYEEALRARLEFVAPAPADLELTSGAPLVHRPLRLADATAADATIAFRLRMAPPPGAFIRWLPGTRVISFDQGGKVFLLDLDTGERIPGPGWIDFVPSPDGRVFVTPAKQSRGLEFYDASEVVGSGRERMTVQPLFVDADMIDQYPSVGVLSSASHGRSVYRVLTSWRSGLAMRDYEFTPGVRPSIQPLTGQIKACQGLTLSTPMLSKDGREIAARDELSGSTKIFRVNASGRCTEVADLGIGTSKVSFDQSGWRLAFSAVADSASTTGYSDAYVLDRRNGDLTKVVGSSTKGLLIPEFVGTDSLVFLTARDGAWQEVELLLACCLSGEQRK